MKYRVTGTWMIDTEVEAADEKEAAAKHDDIVINLIIASGPSNECEMMSSEHYIEEVEECLD